MQETQEMQVWSLGWEDPLELEMAAHSSILAWKIPRTEEPGGSQRVRHDWACKHWGTTLQNYQGLFWSIDEFSVNELHVEACVPDTIVTEILLLPPQGCIGKGHPAQDYTSQPSLWPGVDMWLAPANGREARVAP